MTAVDQHLTRDAFIAGGWRAARSGRRFASIDPSTGEHFADVAEGGQEDIDEAVRSAAAAFPGWRARKPLERGRIVGDVQARPEPDLQHLAVQPGRDPGARTSELTSAQGQVDRAGKDLVRVQAHAISVARPAVCPARRQAGLAGPAETVRRGSPAGPAFLTPTGMSQGSWT